MTVAVANSRVYTRMKERDRLAALGALAAGLAHEVKNPLGAIKGAAQLLEEPDPSDREKSQEQTKEFVGIIIEEVNRLDRVVGSFLDYARPHAGNPIPLDINAAVRRTVQILSSQLSTDTGVDVKLELAEVLPRAKIDPEKLRQVLLNLMQNAIQAMDGRGRVTVTTAPRRGGKPNWTGGPTSSAASPPSSGNGERGKSEAPTSDRAIAVRPEEAEYVEVAVRDTGPGISQKVLKNIFVPFFTTKTKGTGLGLAICQSIVQNAGGIIDVQTQPGAGTTFTVILPSALDALCTPLPPSAAAAAKRKAAADGTSDTPAPSNPSPLPLTR
jgi:signal transduction histidine kinase